VKWICKILLFEFVGGAKFAVNRSGIISNTLQFLSSVGSGSSAHLPN